MKPGDERLLVVEDDATIRALLEMALMGAGFRHVESVGRGDEAMARIELSPPDLVLLDVMLPALDGLEIARRVRSSPKLAATRILMLTALGENEDVVRGLEAGADDYVVKPYDRKVLLARVNALLRRDRPPVSADFDGLVLESAARRASLRGRALDLTAGEFALLERLVAHRGRVLPRPADERSIDVQISNLRRKLGKWADRIETIRGVGYRVKG